MRYWVILTELRPTRFPIPRQADGISEKVTNYSVSHRVLVAVAAGVVVIVVVRRRWASGPVLLLLLLVTAAPLLIHTHLSIPWTNPLPRPAQPLLLFALFPSWGPKARREGEGVSLALVCLFPHHCPTVRARCMCRPSTKALCPVRPSAGPAGWSLCIWWDRG